MHMKKNQNCSRAFAMREADDSISPQWVSLTFRCGCLLLCLAFLDLTIIDNQEESEVTMACVRYESIWPLI